VAALTGNYRTEHLFALRHNFATYEFLLKQIAECDGEIEALLTTLVAQQPPPSAPLPAARRRRASKHQPQFDIRGPLHRLTGGADLSQIDSIGPQTALQLIAEIGTDMRRWPSEYHFASWTSLAPNNRISGGRLLSSRTPPSANRVAAILRRCAMSVGENFDRTRGVLPPSGNPHRQGQSHHCHRPQTCSAGLPRAVRPTRL
jgi:transposase